MTDTTSPTPWRLNRWRLDKPLARCPDATCRRQGRCLALNIDGHCLKTHHRDGDGFAREMTKLIMAFNAKCDRENPNAPPEAWVHGEEAKAEWKRALEERAAELRAERAAAASPPAPRRRGTKRRT